MLHAAITQADDALDRAYEEAIAAALLVAPHFADRIRGIVSQIRVNPDDARYLYRTMWEVGAWMLKIGRGSPESYAARDAAFRLRDAIREISHAA